MAERDRRQFIRLEADHSVRLVETDGGSFPALALDISLSGMQILCDRPTAFQILPEAHLTPRDPKREMHVSIQLPMKDGTLNRMGAFCQLVNVRRIAEDEFRIGLQFLRFDPEAYRILESYIDEQLGD